MDMLSVSMNSVQFGFITQQIQASTFDWQAQVDFICKCYNLFLLFFYFEIMKFVLGVVQRVVRRMSKF